MYQNMKDFFRPLALVYSYIAQGSRTSSGSKHFSYERVLPPLPKLQPDTKYGNAIPVLYTNDPSSASRWFEEHLSDRPLVVGWDVESSQNFPWKKVKYVGPATVQISVLEASLVLQIAQEGTDALADDDYTMPLLRDFLADSTILKAGVGVDQDMLELFRWKPSSPMEISGRMDIGGIGGGSYGRTSSLKNLAKTVLEVDLLKSKKLAMSDWGKAPLTNDQITYAARDAWAAAAIVHELAERDPKTYSTESLQKLILPEECSVDQLDVRAVARKEVKTKLFDLFHKDGEKVDRNDLSDEQTVEVGKLEKEMRKLAPPRPNIFDVGPLGFEL